MKLRLLFRPLGSFAFAGEESFYNLAPEAQNFDRDASQEAQKKRAGYYVGSHRMPQQTTLYGTIRRWLLMTAYGGALYRTNYRAYKADAALSQKKDELIGKGSFQATREGDSGRIQSISPGMLYQPASDALYIRHPLDAHVSQCSGRLCMPFKMEGDKTLMHFSAKEGHVDGYMPYDRQNQAFNRETLLSAQDVFHASDVVGHALSAEGHVADDGRFYIRQRITMKECRLAVIVNLSMASSDLRLCPQILPMGADGSMWEIRATEWEGADLRFDTIDSVQYPGDCVAALSPCVMPAGWRDLSDAGIVQTRALRNLKTETDGSMRRSDVRITMADAGSIWYFKDENGRKQFCEAIQSDNQHFMRIGFNALGIYRRKDVAV